MAEVGTAFVSVIPSARGFGSKLDKEVGPDVDSSGKRVGRRFGTAMKVGALAALTGVAIAGKFLGGAVSAASDLAENQSKVGVVFGKSAGQILAASKTSATAMGLSKNAYLDATGTLGNLLVSLDIAPKKAAGLSQQMVKLAGDMASFNNTSPEEALDALKSGLTGETEPLKRFGVNMNETTLKAQALKMGLVQTTKEALTPQNKALAAQALIMAQTKTAQGDFARTSGGLANQQRILAAQFANVKATLGTALLPIVTRFVTFLNSNVVPGIQRFISGMGDGSGAGGRFARILAGVGRVLSVVGAFIGGTVVPYLQRLWASINRAAGGTRGLNDTMSDLHPTLILVKRFIALVADYVVFALPIMIRWWRLLAKVIGQVAQVAIALWNNAFGPALKNISGALGALMGTWAKMLRALSKVPGFGWAGRAASAMQGAANKATGLSNSIHNIPNNKRSDVKADVRGRGDVDGLVSSIGRLHDKTVYLKAVRQVVGPNAGVFNAVNGHRAKGGPVAAGRSYLVGELGPEIFTPPQSGRIIPNNKIAGGKGGGNTYNINTLDVSKALREAQRIESFVGVH